MDLPFAQRFSVKTVKVDAGGSEHSFKAPWGTGWYTGSEQEALAHTLPLLPQGPEQGLGLTGGGGGAVIKHPDASLGQSPS